MADLQKLFVLVSQAQTDAFKSKYVTAASGRLEDYDNKIVFLEGTGEIFTKGKIYGMSTDQASKLSAIIKSVGLNADGTLPAFTGANYLASADSIIKAVIALDAQIKAVQDELDDEQAKVAASNTLDTNYEFTGKITYVAAKDGVPAHIALIGEDNTELSTVAVSDIIGNGVLQSSKYNKETGILTLTFAQADGTTNTEEVNLADMLDINDVQIAAGSTNYMSVDLTGGENSQAVFSVKVSKMADASLTGLADAKDVKTYVDAQVSGKNVSAEGDTYVTATAANNKVTVAAQIGDMKFTAASGNDAAKLEGVANKLVDSAQAAGAIKSYADAVVAKEAADRAAAITTAINNLDKASTPVNGTNVHVTYKEEDGIVNIESVSEDYATVSRTTSTSTADAPKTDAAISVTDGAKLVIGSDLEKVAAYAADKAKEEQHRVDAKIAALGGDKSGAAAGVSTQVTTAKGEVSGVVVTVADNAVTSGGAEKARTLTVANEANVIKGQAIVQIKDYVDNVVSDNTANLAVSAAGDDYINAAVDSKNNKKINVSADVTTLTFNTHDSGNSTLVGTEKSLVDAKDVADKVSSFVNARVGEEIGKLNVTSTTAGEGNVTFTYSEANGIVSISNVAVKTATVAEGTLAVTNPGQLATGAHIEAVKSYVDTAVSNKNVSAEGDGKHIAASATDNKVTVTGTYASISGETYSNGIADGDFVKAALGNLWETYVG